MGCYPKRPGVSSARMRGRLTVFVLVLVAGLVVGAADPVSANVITRKDGNDTKGPLDLASVKVSHASNASVFQIKTIGAFSNADVALKKGKVQGLFEVALDTNEDKRPNFYVDVVYASGRFRGVLSKPSGDVITYSLKAARVSGHAVKVVVPHSKFANKGSYDFAAFSVYFGSPCTRKSPCLDAIPNRYPLIKHDFTAPTITWGSVPVYSSDVSDTLSFPVPFNLKDDPYGSGLKSWKLQRRAFGDTMWMLVASGSGRSPTPSVLGDPGTTYDLRVVAVDRQGNKAISSVKRTSTPFDDRNPMFNYSVSTKNDAVSGAFFGTTSSIPNGQGVTFISTPGAAQLCILSGPTTGATASASVKIDAIVVATISEDGTTVARTTTCVGSADASNVEIDTSTTEPFVFDGLLLVPA
jgi:hypothetical protein